MIGRAIDLSHHQSASAIPWSRIRETADTCIIRLSYGSGLRDRQCVQHFERARGAGFRVGAYHFYRPSQPVADQLAVFKSQAEACGYGPGDICPWLDIEADPVPKPGAAVSPAWNAPAFELYSAIREAFGVCGIYITQREWSQLGKPQWVLDAPLWIAHYTKSASPATPGGKAPHIWQHRVGVYDPDGPGGYYEGGGLVLDQNRILLPLPRVTAKIVAGPLVPSSEAAEDPDWDNLCARAIAAQIPVTETLMPDALRDMSRDTEPPSAPPTLRDPQFDEPTQPNTPNAKSVPPGAA